MKPNTIRNRARRPALKTTLFLLILLLLLHSRPPGAEAFGILFTELGTLGGSHSVAYDINEKGHIVGESEIATGEMRAFLWQVDEDMADLGTLGGSWSRALGINDLGHVIGESETKSGAMHAFLWQEGVGMTDLGTLGGSSSTPIAINEKGQVVGLSETAAQDYHAFLWQEGVGMTDLGTLGGSQSEPADINELGQVTGWSRTATDDLLAFLWQEGEGMISLGALGGQYSVAEAINDSGQVAGSRGTGLAEDRAFYWDKDLGMIDLGTLGGSFTDGQDINENGQVAGTSDSGAGERHAFLWQKETGMRDLGLLPGQSAAPARPSAAEATMFLAAIGNINNRGQIAGYSGVHSSGSWVDVHAFVAQKGKDLMDLNALSECNKAQAFDINDREQIVGACWNGNGKTAVLWELVGGAPYADFVAAPVAGAPPLLVQFTNLSSGDFDQCLWDFGDDATSDVCDDPQHTYDQEGAYTVSLAVSGPGGDSTNTMANYITVATQSAYLPVLMKP